MCDARPLCIFAFVVFCTYGTGSAHAIYTVIIRFGSKVKGNQEGAENEGDGNGGGRGEGHGLWETWSPGASAPLISQLLPHPGFFLSARKA